MILRELRKIAGRKDDSQGAKEDSREKGVFSYGQRGELTLAYAEDIKGRIRYSSLASQGKIINSY